MNEVKCPNFRKLEDYFCEQVQKFAGHKIKPLNTDEHFFTQIWPNTGGGLAMPGFCYGQAMTRQATTVLYNDKSEIAMVAFGDTPAYLVRQPNDRFWNDLYSWDMLGIRDCRKYGKAIFLYEVER